MQLNLFQYMVEEAKLNQRKLTCPLCSGTVMELKCKRICTNCGYQEDCSDLFIEEPDNERRT